MSFGGGILDCRCLLGFKALFNTLLDVNFIRNLCRSIMSYVNCLQNLDSLVQIKITLRPKTFSRSLSSFTPKISLSRTSVSPRDPKLHVSDSSISAVMQLSSDSLDDCSSLEEDVPLISFVPGWYASFLKRFKNRADFHCIAWVIPLKMFHICQLHPCP